MIDSPRLLADLKKLLPRLEDDLRTRSEEDAATGAHLKAEWTKARDAGRTALAYEAWREDPLTQSAVAWILSCVFLRFLEDNGLLDERNRPARLLQGATPDLQRLAEDRYTHHIRTFPSHSDRDVLLALFREAGRAPGGRAPLRPAPQPRLHARPLGRRRAPPPRVLAEARRGDRRDRPRLHRPAAHDPLPRRPLPGPLRGRPPALRPPPDARVRGGVPPRPDAHPRARGSRLREGPPHRPRLRQRPLPPRRLPPARRPLADGDQPGLPAARAAQGALDSVFGVDLNPYAAAIARFRLLVAALKAVGPRPPRRGARLRGERRRRRLAPPRPEARDAQARTASSSSSATTRSATSTRPRTPTPSGGSSASATTSSSRTRRTSP